MSSFTENYNLIKPANEDYYDVQDFNENMDTIDTQLAVAEKGIQATLQGVQGIADTLGTLPEGQTVASLLQNGRSVIRSVQHVMYASIEAEITSTSVTIHPVNPEKTVVFSERLTNNARDTYSYEYTLTENAILIKHFPCRKDDLKIGFWVVEFV
nr:hypothetical protein [uncultured Anaerotignum sp.]